jgi:hypothetical protein
MPLSEAAAWPGHDGLPSGSARGDHAAAAAHRAVLSRATGAGHPVIDRFARAPGRIEDENGVGLFEPGQVDEVEIVAQAAARAVLGRDDDDAVLGDVHQLGPASGDGRVLGRLDRDARAAIQLLGGKGRGQERQQGESEKGAADQGGLSVRGHFRHRTSFEAGISSYHNPKNMTHPMFWTRFGPISSIWRHARNDREYEDRTSDGVRPEFCALRQEGRRIQVLTPFSRSSPRYVRSSCPSGSAWCGRRGGARS